MMKLRLRKVKCLAQGCTANALKKKQNKTRTRSYLFGLHGRVFLRITLAVTINSYIYLVV